jgi:hybrid cluster-associated redox disulfide protein
MMQRIGHLLRYRDDLHERKYLVHHSDLLTAKQVHPEAGLVFSSYHLGGCSHCSINEIETIEQVCQGYGVEVEVLLDSLNNLFAEDES